MKKNWILQKEGINTDTNAVEKEVKKRLKDYGIATKDIKTLTFYFNADEGNTYYVAEFANGSDLTGAVLKDELDFDEKELDEKCEED